MKEFKAFLDSGLHAMDSGFQVLDSRSFSVELGFQLLVGFRIPRPRISDSKGKHFQDSGFHIQKFPRFRIPPAKIFQEIGIPHAKISKIPDSTRKNFQDSRFHKQNFPRFWNPDSLTWGDRFLLDYNCLIEGSKLKSRQSVILLFVCFLGDFCGS